MTDFIYRPILFSGAMVKAILAGRKTQTRRAIQPRIGGLAGMGFWGYDHDDNDDTPFACFGTDMYGMVHRLRCPYGASGGRLWVRETWGVRRLPAGLWVEYQADGYNARLPEPHEHDIRDEGGKVDLGRYASDRWRRSIHMPRWASRLELEITGVRVERVQDITPDDAYAEGVREVYYEHAVGAFRMIWDEINARRGYDWDANPWVWVVEFKRIGP